MPLSLPVRGRGGERLPLWREIMMSFCYLSKSAIPKPLDYQAHLQIGRFADKNLFYRKC